MFSTFAKLLKLPNKSKQNLRAIMTTDIDFKGNSMDEIYRGLNPWELPQLPPIVNKRDHSVLFQLPINLNSTEPPQPHRSDAKWDSNHVRLPCAIQNEYLTHDENNPETTIKKSRWEIIQTALLQPIRSSRELEKAILTYNTKYAKYWKFYALHELFEEELDETEAATFFSDTLPEIIRLALQLPDIIPSSIPLLKHGHNGSISLSQKQVACLLANAFLCTFPRRNEQNRNSEYRNFPTINFNSLYQMRHSGEQVLEKIKCICFYFRTVCKKMPIGVITFARRTISPRNFPDWSKCESTFNESSMIHVSADGTIEDDGDGLLQVDFANKYIGGGVLGCGCVQEEIRFVICPELLCSRLFTERLDQNESLIMMGCERFNSYRGYASSFKWIGAYEDNTPFDTFRRKKCTIVAIDAIRFRDKTYQFQEEMIKRELNKAFAGFYHELNSPAPAVATGNWGCGAFNGDKSLKSLLQLMVCCVTNRSLVYFTFGDNELRDNLYSMFLYLKENRVKISELWSYLNRFRDHKLDAEHLYSFIMQCHKDASKQMSMSSAKNNAQTTSTHKHFENVLHPIHSSTDQNVSVQDGNSIENDNENDLMDDDEILRQIEATESSILLKRKKSPIKPNFNENAPEKSAAAALAAAVGAAAPSVIEKILTPNEYQEKRQRSLLDCLDQSYYNEMPSKIKRPSESPITNFLHRQPDKCDQSFSSESDPLIKIAENQSSIDLNETDAVDSNSEPQQLSSITEINSNSIREMDNGLESLHVVAEPSSSEIDVDTDVIPCTPPSSKPFLSTEKCQRTMFDYFKKS